MKRVLFVILFALFTLPQIVSADSSYSSGSYGSCTYSTCGISLTSDSTLANNITPNSGTTCSVTNDSVAVTTDSSTGYTLKLGDTDTSNQLSGINGTISASSGSQASPSMLTTNSWGYRVDRVGGFGTGPTTSLMNGGIPSQGYAAIPLSSTSPDTVASSASAADPAVTTAVWFGICVNNSLSSGTYTDNVTYTAVTN